MEKEFERSAGIRSNFTTVNIVSQIRCEARYAVAAVTMDFLRAELNLLKSIDNKTPFERQFLADIENNGEPEFDRLLENLYRKEDGEHGFTEEAKQLQIDDGGLTLGDELKLIEEFAKSGIGYTFTFTITEDNNLSDGVLGFRFPKVGKTRTLGVGGAYKRQRKNKRVFSFAESIEDLVFDPRLKALGYCNEIKFEQTKRRNWHYPIYGVVGLKEIFQTYAWLALVSPFGSTDNDSVDDRVRNLTDTIQFSTAVNGSLTPAFGLTSAITEPRLTSASARLSSGRTDNHQLTLLLKPKGIDRILDQLEDERAIRAAADGS